MGAGAIVAVGPRVGDGTGTGVGRAVAVGAGVDVETGEPVGSADLDV